MAWVTLDHAAGTAILSEDGWPYASSLPVDAKDSGRFHALFGRDSLIFSLQVLPVLYAVSSGGPERIAIANRAAGARIGGGGHALVHCGGVGEAGARRG